MAAGKPVLYHVHSRVVDRRFVVGTEEKEKFRTYMRMQENFTGCWALSYCLMDNRMTSTTGCSISINFIPWISPTLSIGEGFASPVIATVSQIQFG